VSASAVRYAKDLAAHHRYDLVVCGGGPSGIPAALAARRAGLSVLLVEAQGQLGGVTTSAGVSHLLGGRTPDNRHQLVGGIFQEIADELVRRGGAIDPRTIDWTGKYQPHGWNKGSLGAGVPVDPYLYAALLDETMLDAGVDVLFFTQFVDVVRKGDRVSRVVLANKSGLFAVPAQLVVDATGDADVAARAGCEVTKGREADGLMTPASLIFHVDHVDQDALASEIYQKGSPRFRELIQDLREREEWTFPYEIFISVQLAQKGTMMINTTRITDVDGTDGRSISRGMMQGRREVLRLLDMMRRHFPGFAGAQLKMVAPVLGIRETRRIVGDFVLRVDDLVAGADFPDPIGFSGYGWDLPDPQRPSHQPMTGVQRKRAYTPIPYRVMVPRPVTNVICPGRAISVERDVLGPLREQAPCYAMGHAAGLAAAQAARERLAFKDVDAGALREALVVERAIVEFSGGE
jgi:glycine/D-amino acid oxidase-like deaminating enzyme